MKTSEKRNFVSIIIPCLNEAYSIGACVTKAKEAVEKLKLSYEVVVVDNCSTDNTAIIAKHAGALVVSCQRKGYGASVQAGINASSGAIIVVGDGDGSYDFSQLSAFVTPLLTRDGVILGNRFNCDSPRPGAMPWSHRYIGNPLLSQLLNISCFANIKDAHCGLRSFTKRTYLDIGASTNGFEYCSEMLIRAIKKGIDINQVSIILHCTHPSRHSKLRTIRDGFRHLLVIIFFIFGSRTGSKLLYIFNLSQKT